MQLDKLDLIVRDVPTAAAFFARVLGVQLEVNEARYAEFALGPVTIMLSPEAMVPMQPAAGVILHVRVEDVAQALSHARDQGATVRRDVSRTDWGWESAMIAGPEGIIIDFYRELAPPAPLALGDATDGRPERANGQA